MSSRECRAADVRSHGRFPGAAVCQTVQPNLNDDLAIKEYHSLRPYSAPGWRSTCRFQASFRYRRLSWIDRGSAWFSDFVRLFWKYSHFSPFPMLPCLIFLRSYIPPKKCNLPY